MPPRRANRATRPFFTGCTGFTLVELMVALVVMALLSLMSWRGLDAMARAQEQTQARADAVQTVRTGLAQWVADLDAMASELFSPGAASQAPAPIDWNGRVLRITRYSPADGSDQPGLQVVAWLVGNAGEAKTWLRWQSPVLRSQDQWQRAWMQAATWAQSPSEGSRDGQVGIVPVLDWQVFYYRGDAWTNPASSGDTASPVPDGVRLQITLPPGHPLAGKLSRDWIRPTVVGNKS